MLTKRTSIGIGIASVIIAIGVVSAVLHLGLQTVNVDETFGVGEFTSYRLNAPMDAQQSMTVNADIFEVRISSPGEGYDIPLTSKKGEQTFSWTHSEDGESRIDLKNTGNSEMSITAAFVVSTDPLFLTYDIMVIIAGIVIIGFSLGFSIRKPRGF